MLFLVNLQSHEKDDGSSQTDVLSDSTEVQRGIQTVVRRVSADVQADYLAVTKCKKLLILLANFVIYMYEPW